MSLVAYAMRTCLRQALLGQTLAEDRVFDSLIAAIPSFSGEGVSPLIIISTDDDEGKVGCLNARLEPSEREQTLIVELAVASTVTVEAGAATAEIPHTDDGLEMILDLLRHRVWRVITDPANPWSDLFRVFLGDGKRYFTRRGADDTKGVLFAARQLLIVCDPMPEPVRGEDIGPGTAWGDFLALMRGTEELAAYADLLAGEVTGESLPEWQILQARLGMARASVEALGLGPLPGLQSTPPATRLSIDTPLGHEATASLDGEA